MKNKNPHPCAECGIGNDHGRFHFRLRAARMGAGSFFTLRRKRKLVRMNTTFTNPACDCASENVSGSGSIPPKVDQRQLISWHTRQPTGKPLNQHKPRSAIRPRMKCFALMPRVMIGRSTWSLCRKTGKLIHGDQFRLTHPRTRKPKPLQRLPLSLIVNASQTARTAL